MLFSSCFNNGNCFNYLSVALYNKLVIYQIKIRANSTIVKNCEVRACVYLLKRRPLYVSRYTRVGFSRAHFMVHFERR